MLYIYPANLTFTHQSSSPQGPELGRLIAEIKTIKGDNCEQNTKLRRHSDKSSH
jgi:hypothetical protein